MYVFNPGINPMLHLFWNKEKKINPILYIIVGLIVTIGVNLLFISFGADFSVKSFSEMEKAEFIVGILVFAPLFESIIFQLIIIEGFRALFMKLFKRKLDGIVLLISVVSFAAAHYYSPVYFIVVLITGFWLSSYYMVVRKERNSGTAFLYTVLFHFLYNLSALGISYLLTGSIC